MMATSNTVSNKWFNFGKRKKKQIQCLHFDKMNKEMVSEQIHSFHQKNNTNQLHNKLKILFSASHFYQLQHH